MQKEDVKLNRAARRAHLQRAVSKTESASAQSASAESASADFKTHDIGVNFASKRYTDADVEREMTAARDGGVECVVSITNSLRELPRNAMLAQHYERLFYTVGVHPHSARNVRRDELSFAITNAFRASSKCIAIGECGLDYNRMFSDRATQLECFSWHVDLARELNKPLYLHCRSADGDATQAAFTDMLRILDARGAGVRAVVHCFTGTAEQARAFVDRGYFLGITGWIGDARRNADLLDAVRVVPRERLLVETDAPWLPLNHSRERMSHPCDTREIVRIVAEARGDPVAELGRAMHANSAVALGIGI